ncbi:MAG: hypothetical protein WDZ53_08205, partial [Balneolales bacterium]
TVTANPDRTEYREGTEVTLTAEAAESWIFDEWRINRVDRGSSNPLTLHMNNDKSVVAVFEKLAHPLTITVVGDGSVSQEIVPAKTTTEYEDQTRVELTAEPGNVRWQFSRWEGNLSGSNRTEVVLVDRPLDITALFSERCCLRTYGGSGQEEARAVVQTDQTDKHFVITGWTTSGDGDFEGNTHHGNRDIFLLEVDALGELKWSRIFGGSGSEEGYAVVRTAGGGLVVAGSTNSNDGDFDNTNRGEKDFFLLKTNSNGQQEWIRAFGGSGNDEAHSVILTADGGFLITGEMNSSDGDLSSLNQGGADAVFIKTDSNGTLEWIQSIGGTGPDMGFSAVQREDGSFTVTGWTNSVDGDFIGREQYQEFDIFLASIDATGNKQWIKTFGGSKRDRPNSISLADNGSTILTGTTRSADGDFGNADGVSEDIFLMKNDSNGNRQWARAYGGSDSDNALSVTRTENNGWLLTGSTASMNGDFEGLNQDGNSIFLIQTDSNGSPQWIKTYGGDSSEEGTFVYRDSDDFLYLTGWTRSNDKYFSGLGKGERTSFLLRLNKDGDLFGQL